MLIAIVVLTALTVILVTVVALQFAGGRSAAVTQQLDQLASAPGTHRSEIIDRRRRQARSERLKGILQLVGERMETGRRDTSAVRLFLIQAGYPDATAVAYYWSARVMLCAGLGAAAIFAFPFLGATRPQVMLGTLWFAALGWIGPTFYVRFKLQARQKEVQLALPDMLDMMVVCVEAGLGLNQALMRVADEIDHVSPVTAEQLTMVNLQIRAGTPREEALLAFAERTGLPDIKSLVGMLIQTERFGTSIADALRIHSDTMRTKRRQRAEEAAAKTTIKLVFPLVLFIFPAMFVVVLGPSIIGLYRMFANLKI